MHWPGITDNEGDRRLIAKQIEQRGRKAAEKIHEDKIRQNRRKDASTTGSHHPAGSHMDNRSL